MRSAPWSTSFSRTAVSSERSTWQTGEEYISQYKRISSVQSTMECWKGDVGWGRERESERERAVYVTVMYQHTGLPVSTTKTVSVSSVPRHYYTDIC